MDKSYLKDIKVREIVQNFKPFKELNSVPQEQHIDLIMMGSHGANGLSEFFVGSNTEKVVRTSEVPVLVVKIPNPDFRVENILFACDFKDNTSLAFKNAKAFAASFSAGLQFIYSNTPYNRFYNSAEIEERISRFFSRQEIPLKN